MLPPTGRASPETVAAIARAAPPRLAALPPGSALTAVVVVADAPGRVVVETAYGRLALATRLALSEGAEIALRVVAGPGFRAAVEAIDGESTAPRVADPTLPRSPPPLAAATDPPPPPRAAPARGALAHPAVTLTLGRPLPAVVVTTTSTAVGEIPETAPAPPLAPGATLAVRILAPLPAEPPSALAAATPPAPLPSATAPAVALPPTAPASAPASAPGTPTATAGRAPIPPGASPAPAGTRTGPPATTIPAAGAAADPSPGTSRGGTPPPVGSAVGRPPAPTTRGGIPAAPTAVPPTRPGTPATATARPSAGEPAAARGRVPGSAPSPRPSAPAHALLPTGPRSAKPAVASPAAAANRGAPHPATAAPRSGAAAHPVAATPRAAGTTPPAGTTIFPTTVAAARPQAAPALFAEPAAASQRLPARVVAVDTAGRPTLATEAGEIAITEPLPVRPGERLLLAIAPAPPATTPVVAADWPALAEALATLTAVDPAAGHRAAEAIPQPGPRLAATALFFLAAVRGGDLGRWLGAGPLRVLERQAPGLVSRLGREVARHARPAETGPAAPWQALAIPLWSEGRPETVRLYVHDRGADDDEGAERGQRFVVEVALSRLGDLQLDGLVRARRLDLVLRSRKPLPAGAADDLRGLYGESLAAVGYEGALAFQVRDPFPVSPRGEGGEAVTA